MGKVELHRLGDYIQEVSVRNSDLAVTQLMGISIDKFFMPSVANTIGTDLSNYKIVENGQLACNLMHVGRDKKIPSALNQGPAIIVSPAYFVFEISSSDIIPEFLDIVLKRPEFDRNAWFHTDGDVRGGMDKEGMMDLLIPVPTIDEQIKIIQRYKAIRNRIENNRHTIIKLEEAAQSIYRKMFVDDINPENLPTGWKGGSLTDIAEFLNGIACQKFETQCSDYYPVIKIRELSQGDIDENSDKASMSIPSKYIIKYGDILFSWSASLLVSYWCGTTGALNQHIFKVVPNNVPDWYCYFAINNQIEEWNRVISAKAVSMGHIKREDLEEAWIAIPDKDTLEKADSLINPIIRHILSLTKENLIHNRALGLIIN